MIKFLVLVLATTYIYASDMPNDNFSMEHQNSYGSAFNESRECPSWSIWNKSNGNCECRHKFFNDLLICSEDGQLKVLQCHCATFNEASRLIEVGHCIYGCTQMDDYFSLKSYKRLPLNVSQWNEAMCGHFNRKGTLCGHCAPGFHSLGYSYNETCVKCSQTGFSFLTYIVVAFLPLTIFYFVVQLFKINIPSSRLQGYVLMCQLVTAPIVCRLLIINVNPMPKSLFQITKFIATLLGIWNMDFFRLYDFKICSPLSSLGTLSLDLLIAVYPLLLMVLTYFVVLLYDCKFKVLEFLWKPLKTFFHHFQIHWNVKTSTIDAFATFLLLSNVKFVSVCFDLLMPKKVHQYDLFGKYKGYTWKLFYDGTLNYLGSSHLPFAVLALCVVTIFVLLPVVILLIFSQSTSRKLVHFVLLSRWELYLHTFVDAFQGQYKNGTENNGCNYRWVSVLPFVIRIAIFLTYASAIDPVFVTSSSVFLVLTGIIMIIINPFNRAYQLYNSILVLYLLLSATLASCLSILYESKYSRGPKVFYLIVSLTVVVVSLLHVSSLSIRWLLSQRKFRLTKN